MKHSFPTGGGKLSYTSPNLELLELTIEQGFANSPANGEWDNSLNSDLTWGEADDDLF